MAEYIDVTPLKKQIKDFKQSVHSSNCDYMTGYLSAISATEGIIADIPTADVQEVKHGKLNDITDFGNGVCFGYCSNCGSEHRAINPSVLKLSYRFCRWCGAKMDGAKNG